MESVQGNVCKTYVIWNFEIMDDMWTPLRLKVQEKNMLAWLCFCISDKLT